MDSILSESPILVLVIDDSADERRIVGRWLEVAGHQVETRASGPEGIEALSQLLPDVVLLDIQMDGMNGMEVLHRVRASHPQVPVIMLTADMNPNQVVRAIKGEGAYDYLVKPPDRAKLITTVRNAAAHGRMASRLRRLQTSNGGILGESPPIQKLQSQIERLAPRDITVLVHGESGTGKELVANAIHRQSGRRGPFVAINCAAVPENLAESELFGHEKGVFTGAVDRRAGRFEQANGGTLFLDEVAELTPAIQAMLLRVLAERRFTRVGGREEVKVDVRLVTASHKDLAAEVRAGRFREDLYFRLAVFEVSTPPLRVRGGDILILAAKFVDDCCRQYNVRSLQLAPETEALMLRYSWPGNVRELQNAISRAVVDSADGWIRPENLPRHIRDVPNPAPTVAPTPVAMPAAPRPKLLVESGEIHTLEEVIRLTIEASLRRHHYNVMAACRELAIPRTTMYRKLRDYGLSREDLDGSEE